MVVEKQRLYTPLRFEKKELKSLWIVAKVQMGSYTHFSNECKKNTFSDGCHEISITKNIIIYSEYQSSLVVL